MKTSRKGANGKPGKTKAHKAASGRRLRHLVQVNEREKAMVSTLRETMLALTRGNEALRASDDALWKRYEDMRRRYGELVNAYDCLRGRWQKVRGVISRSCDVLAQIKFPDGHRDLESTRMVLEALRRAHQNQCDSRYFETE